ncbi:MAG: hypothetical protein AAF195_02125 [Pseudomonadota bacterium]
MSNDTSGNAINDVKVYLPTTDNGNRVNLVDLAMQNGLDATSTDYDLYEATTSSGETSVIKVLTGRIYCDRRNSIAPTRTLYSKTNIAGTDDYSAELMEYGYNLITAELILQGASDITVNIVMINDNLITNAKSTVDAYTTIDDAFEFYDRAKSYLYDNFAGETAVLMSRQGATATLGADNITLDATASSAFTYTSGSPNNFTLHTDIFTGGITTTGTITLQNGTILNGGTFNGDISTADNNITHTNITASKFIHTTSSTATVTFDNSDVTEIEVTGGGTLTVNLTNGSSIPTTTETSGTINLVQNVTVSDTNIIDGSRVQLYNVTKSVELNNSIVSGGSGYSFDVNLQSSNVDNNDTLRLRVTFQSGTAAKNPLEVSGVVTTNGLSFINTQTDNAVYNSNGVDGSLITEFSWDSGNLEIDINDVDNQTSIQNIAAWYNYFITTAIGIDEAFGAITWDNLLTVQINSNIVNVTLDNINSNTLRVTGGRIFNTELTDIISLTSNSIHIDVELNNRPLTDAQNSLLISAEQNAKNAFAVSV